MTNRRQDIRMIAFCLLFTLASIVLLTCITCTSGEAIRERPSGIHAATFVANRVMDLDLAKMLSQYVRAGALKPGDTIVADDGVAMVIIGEFGLIGWVRLKPDLREGEITWPVDGHIARAQRVSLTPDFRGVWTCRMDIR